MPHETTNGGGSTGSEVNPDFRDDPFGKKKVSTPGDEKGAKTGPSAKKKEAKKLRSRFDEEQEAIDKQIKRMGEFTEKQAAKELDALRKVYTDSDNSLQERREAFRQSQRIQRNHQATMERIIVRGRIARRAIDRSRRVFNKSVETNVFRENRNLTRRFKKEKGRDPTPQEVVQLREDATVNVGNRVPGEDLDFIRSKTRLEFKPTFGGTDRFTQRQGSPGKEREAQRRSRQLVVKGPRGRLQRELNQRQQEASDFKRAQKLRRLVILEREGVLSESEDRELEGAREEAVARTRFGGQASPTTGRVRQTPITPVSRRIGGFDGFADPEADRDRKRKEFGSPPLGF